MSKFGRKLGETIFMNKIPQNSILPQNPITPPPPSPQPYVSPAISPLPTSPLPPASQPIPIQRELTPQQEDELCGSFHEHSVRCAPITLMRSGAFYFRPNANPGNPGNAGNGDNPHNE